MSAALCFAMGSASLAGATSPLKNYGVAHENGEVFFFDKASGKRVGEILAGDGATIEAVIGKWSPDGTKVAVVVQHRRWNDVFIFERNKKEVRRVNFTVPDAFSIYAQQRPKDHPEALKRLTNDDGINKWISNSEVSMITSYEASNSKDADDIYTISVNYIIEVKEGQAKVKSPALKVSP